VERHEANQRTVRRMVDAINDRDLDALDELVAADVRRHSAATPDVTVESLEQFKEFLRQDFAAVPDSRLEIERIFAGGDHVGLRVIYRGTQKGPLGPFPPSDRSFELPFLGIARIADGKIAELWAEWDNLAMLTQLGHFPPGEPGAGDRAGDGNRGELREPS